MSCVGCVTMSEKLPVVTAHQIVCVLEQFGFQRIRQLLVHVIASGRRQVERTDAVPVLHLAAAVS